MLSIMVILKTLHHSCFKLSRPNNGLYLCLSLGPYSWSFSHLKVEKLLNFEIVSREMFSKLSWEVAHLNFVFSSQSWEFSYLNFEFAYCFHGNPLKFEICLKLLFWNNFELTSCSNITENGLIFETGFGVSQLWENVYNDYFLLISLIFWLL